MHSSPSPFLSIHNQSLYALQTLLHRLIHNVDIQLLHHPNHYAQALEEPVYGNAQHAVRCCGVVDNQDILFLLLVRASEAESAAYEGREFGIDGERALCGGGIVVRWEGDFELAVQVNEM